MITFPYISICIPAFQGEDYLKRLLDSINIQTFKNYEVIISDDSPDDSVERLSENYSNSFRLIYQKNKEPLGSPANWNKSISLANGKWIKIMHDDDWFYDKYALEEFF